MSKLEDDLIHSMCMTWDHSFGLMPKHQQESLRRAMAQLVEHDVGPYIARAIMAAEAEAEAERDLLQSILDGRPAINAALPDSYIIWSQAIYSGEAVRVALSRRGEW